MRGTIVSMDLLTSPRIPSGSEGASATDPNSAATPSAEEIDTARDLLTRHVREQHSGVPAWIAWGVGLTGLGLAGIVALAVTDAQSSDLGLKLLLAAVVVGIFLLYRGLRTRANLVRAQRLLTRPPEIYLGKAEIEARGFGLSQRTRTFVSLTQPGANFSIASVQVGTGTSDWACLLDGSPLYVWGQVGEDPVLGVVSLSLQQARVGRVGAHWVNA